MIRSLPAKVALAVVSAILLCFLFLYNFIFVLPVKGRLEARKNGISPRSSKRLSFEILDSKEVEELPGMIACLCSDELIRCYRVEGGELTESAEYPTDGRFSELRVARKTTAGFAAVVFSQEGQNFGVCDKAGSHLLRELHSDTADVAMSRDETVYQLKRERARVGCSLFIYAPSTYELKKKLPVPGYPWNLAVDDDLAVVSGGDEGKISTLKRNSTEWSEINDDFRLVKAQVVHNRVVVSSESGLSVFDGKNSRSARFPYLEQHFLSGDKSMFFAASKEGSFDDSIRISQVNVGNGAIRGVGLFESRVAGFQGPSLPVHACLVNYAGNEVFASDANDIGVLFSRNHSSTWTKSRTLNLRGKPCAFLKTSDKMFVFEQPGSFKRSIIEVFDGNAIQN